MVEMPLHEETNALRLSRIPFKNFVRADVTKRGRYWFVDVTLKDLEPLTRFRYSTRDNANEFLDMIYAESDRLLVTDEEQQIIDEMVEEATSSNESNVVVLGLMIVTLFSIILGMLVL